MCYWLNKMETQEGKTDNWWPLKKRRKYIASERQNEWKLHGNKGQAALSLGLLWAMLSGNCPESTLRPGRTGGFTATALPGPATEGDLKFQGVENLGCPGTCPKKSSGKINMPPGRLTKWWKIPDCLGGGGERGQNVDYITSSLSNNGVIIKWVTKTLVPPPILTLLAQEQLSGRSRMSLLLWVEVSLTLEKKALYLTKSIAAQLQYPQLPAPAETQESINECLVNLMFSKFESTFLPFTPIQHKSMTLSCVGFVACVSSRH